MSFSVLNSTNEISGTTIMPANQSSVVVNLGTTLPHTNYLVLFGVEGVSLSFPFVTNKTTTSFTINVATPPLSSVTIRWIVKF